MIINSEEEMLEIGAGLAAELTGKVVELVGDVGAGKTTLVRGLAKGLGVVEDVTSPSFTISKSYAFPDGRLVHYDFYRLGEPGIMMEDLQEAVADPETVVAVEWGETVANVLPAERTIVEIFLNEDGTREILINGR